MKPEVATLAPPRTLATVLADLRHATRDYHDALASHDEDAEDRASEAEQRVEELRDEFDSRLVALAGLSIDALMKAREEAIL